MDININVRGTIGLEVRIPGISEITKTMPSTTAPIGGNTPKVEVKNESKEAVKRPEPHPEPVTPAQTSDAGETTKKAESETPPLQSFAEEVKTAIAEVRNRIEGPDWMTNTSAEGYKKYHRALNALFKEEAGRIGQCKPTQLSDEVSVREFKEFCRMITVKDGSLYVDRSLDSVLNAVSEPPF